MLHLNTIWTPRRCTRPSRPLPLRSATEIPLDLGKKHKISFYFLRLWYTKSIQLYFEFLFWNSHRTKFTFLTLIPRKLYLFLIKLVLKLESLSRRMTPLISSIYQRIQELKHDFPSWNESSLGTFLSSSSFLLHVQ